MEDKEMEKPIQESTQKAVSTVPKTTMIMAIIVALLLAFPAGYAIGVLSNDDAETVVETAETTEDADDHTHTDDTSDNTSDMHSHNMYEVPEGVEVPEITMINVSEDIKSGWNLHFETDNFTFAPESASGDHVEGEGHAHLYVDGVKITRLYATDYYIGELSEGEHTITVTLNTNDHQDYAVDGEVVEASQTVMDMHHSDE
jgi:hypothetical protein